MQRKSIFNCSFSNEYSLSKCERFRMWLSLETSQFQLLQSKNLHPSDISYLKSVLFQNQSFSIFSEELLRNFARVYLNLSDNFRAKNTKRSHV